MTRSLMLAAVALPAAAPSAVLRSAAALSAAGVSPALVTASAAGAFSSAGGVDASGALQPAKRKGMAVAVQHSFFILSSLVRSEEHTSELQSLMRISYAVFSLEKKKIQPHV